MASWTATICLEVYNQFDFANPDITTGKRFQTIVPQQALFMMNNPLVVEQAWAMVRREDFLSLSGRSARLRPGFYDLIYQREPTPAEMKLGLTFLKHDALPDGKTSKKSPPALN